MCMAAPAPIGADADLIWRQLEIIDHKLSSQMTTQVHGSGASTVASINLLIQETRTTRPEAKQRQLASKMKTADNFCIVQ